jgi:hypothetical protein
VAVSSCSRARIESGNVAVTVSSTSGFQPLQVCRGGILDYPQKKLAQADVIIWSPHPAPPIFNIERFGLVPRSSAFGTVEVKKSNYSGVDTELDKFVSNIERQREKSEASGIPSNFPTRALGVMAALNKRPSRRLRQLMEEKKVVAIFDLRTGQKKVRVRDVVVLINFLYTVMWSAWKHHSLEKPPLLITKD